MRKFLILVLIFFAFPAFAADRIVYTQPDGGISIVSPAQKVPTATALTKSIPEDAIDVTVVDHTTLPSDRTFRDAWKQTGGIVSVNMPTARGIHGKRIAQAQAVEIARLKIEERSERLKGNTAQADAHAATLVALEALDLNVLATQIAAAPNPTALEAVWPVLVPR